MYSMTQLAFLDVYRYDVCAPFRDGDISKFVQETRVGRSKRQEGSATADTVSFQSSVLNAAYGLGGRRNGRFD
jgi:hypothetical protein